MSKLKLRPLEDEAPVKMTLDVPPATYRNLMAYAQAHAAQTGGKVAEPVRLVVPMLDQFMASDRVFTRGRKGRAD
ncbi:DUF2274 domain-containing protein [Caulobacter sp.]|jgi:hypothetical protein|uniref:DUF2274 domain-containing protein n=1 Tax=Caulobacter sp. TaxID=78 RepID=UPI0031E2C2A8